MSLVASNLSAVARARTEEADGRRDELARLFDLSRDVLMMTDSQEALSVLARAISRRFDLEFVAIAMPHEGDWRLHAAGAPALDVDRREIASAFAAAQTTLEFDAHARTYAGHRTTTVEGRSVRLVPLRVGTRPIGVLAASGRPVEAGTLDALAGVAAIGIERAHLLEERKAAELTRQSEQLKTTLLASLSHDLRTPLTAIRIAASNLNQAELTSDERLEQGDLILSEVERLSRLFQNVLEMARIDAGAVPTESRWTHPSEIVAAARDQVEHALQRRTGDGGVRSRRARATGSSADGDGAGAPARERRAVHARRLRDRRRRPGRRRYADDSGARSRPRHRAGRSAAAVRAFFPRRRGERPGCRARAWDCGS